MLTIYGPKVKAVYILCVKCVLCAICTPWIDNGENKNFKKLTYVYNKIRKYKISWQNAYRLSQYNEDNFIFIDSVWHN